MRKIIISGSSGFLGSHLVNRLKKDGYEVIGWDIEEGNDVCNPKLTAKNIEAIFHLACPVNPNDYKKVAVPTMLASSIGTYNILELAKKNEAKFLYVSSSEVYGNSSSIPFKETDPGIVKTSDERSYYGEAKRFGETLTMIYHHFYGLDVRIVRPFNIYGSGMRKDDTRVIPSFLRAKKEGKPLKINDSGKSTRTFCYIDDFIEGITRAMFYDNTNGEIFNLGTTEEVSMLELANMIDFNIEMNGDNRKGEQKKRCPDISKAERLLDWKPRTNLKKGLELMWKSYQ